MSNMFIPHMAQYPRQLQAHSFSEHSFVGYLLCAFPRFQFSRSEKNESAQRSQMIAQEHSQLHATPRIKTVGAMAIRTPRTEMSWHMSDII